MTTIRFVLLATCLAGGLFAGDASSAGSWSPQAAANYLDGRMTWWIGWPTAARDHDTFCVSCHTALPYAMGRAALRSALGEKGPSAGERKLLENVTKRVRMWNEVEPFYPDEKRGAPKTTESRGTESILNAVILTRYNAPAAEQALDNMWALQVKTGEDRGAWPWLQFHNAPWEGDSQYLGAVLAAIAAAGAPASYSVKPDNLAMLRDYLARGCKSQILLDQVMLLSAAAKLPGILNAAEQKAIVEEALGKQQPDGGFSLSSFVGDWKRHDKTPLDARSDGYATGVVVMALRQAGISADHPQLKKAIAWLRTNQDKTEGRWFAYSLNKERDLASDVGKFMSDAATAYAVLALQSTN
ncbi:MAG TPA: hypothetical protein VKU01_32190 [Bryobacteraceae bacterium]|nr:hypothetical protein [Bryobacteraceae bacterium]